MQVRLTKEHEEWLRQQIAAGRFSSFEEGVAEAIGHLKGDVDGLDWVVPLVARGLTELDRHEGICAHEVFARIEARLRKNS